MEEQWPEVWKRCYPRVYNDSRLNEYHSPRLVAADMVGNVIARFLALSTPETESVNSSQYDFILANQLARFGVPMFFLSRSLAEALEYTTPPVAIAWHDMQLPYDAAVFMLPRGLLTHPTDGDCTYISYGRAKFGEMHESVLLPKHGYGILNGGFIIHAGTTTARQFHYHWPYTPAKGRSDAAVFPVLNLRDLKSEMSRGSDDTSLFFFPEGMTADDHLFVRTVAHYVFSSIMILLNCPDLVERGRLLKRVQKNGKPGREFWTPNVIGARYRVAQTRAVATGSHASPRAHWRRGHWRQQPYGANLSLRRDTWIQPVLVNAEG